MDEQCVALVKDDQLASNDRRTSDDQLYSPDDFEIDDQFEIDDELRVGYKRDSLLSRAYQRIEDALRHPVVESVTSACGRKALWGFAGVLVFWGLLMAGWFGRGFFAEDFDSRSESQEIPMPAPQMPVTGEAAPEWTGGLTREQFMTAVLREPVEGQPDLGPLTAKCAEVKWQPGLVWHCSHIRPGLVNALNAFETCLRYGLEAGGTALPFPCTPKHGC